MCCRVNLAIESVIPLVPQFVNHELSIVNALNKSAGIWSPVTIFRRSPDVTHWSASDHTVGKEVSVGDAVGDKSDYSKEIYKADLKIG